MNLSEYKNIYFIGIGGIGMSALARYFNKKDINIFGYDKVKNRICEDLENEGVNIHYLEEEEISLDVYDTLVVYTPAIPEDHIELDFFRKNNYIILKRSELLGIISKNHFTIAVSGTHGKTTTSTILTHLLKESNLDCTSFVGGVSKNYNSNVLIGTEDSIMIVEADEYDRSFLHLNPDIAIITSIDADHLDIYKNKYNLELAFSEFTQKIKSGGSLYIEANIDSTFIKRKDISLYTYSINIESDFSAKNISKSGNTMKFDFSCSDENIQNLNLNMGGDFNVLNSVAAISVAKKMGCSNTSISKSLSTFKGINRRFDIHINNERYIYIDDYAHHPEEVKLSICAVKKMYPKRNLTVVFQPHLYSRTIDFLDDFAKALSIADQLILTEIYAAREKDCLEINSSMLLQKCSLKKKFLCSLKEVPDFLFERDLDIVMTLGAGDISTIVEIIKKRFDDKNI
tara:strand:- start:3365 stop:4735 length:1371 start_codon:yes stop_codon:yes gene_type:complete